MRYIIFNYYKESPFKFFEEFAIYFDKNGYFDVAQGKNQLYKILLDFYNESINKNNDLFNDILKYDYISLGKTCLLYTSVDLTLLLQKVSYQ